MTTSHALFELDELEPGTARKVDIGGVKVAVVRIDDDVYAIGDVCTHADVSLSDGEVWCDERELECPKHSSAFSLLTGEPQTLPATQPVHTHTHTQSLTLHSCINIESTLKKKIIKHTHIIIQINKGKFNINPLPKK